MKKVVITGATSFIGIHIVEECINRGYEVIAIIRPGSMNRYRLKQSNLLQTIELDMVEYDKIIEYVHNADYFFHLAWDGVRVPKRDDREIQRRNCACTLLAFETASRIGCSCFVGAGSQAEYGVTKEKVDEDHLCHPLTAYGVEKYNAFMSLLEKAKLNRIRFLWPRIFSIYGLYDYQNTLVMSILRKMQNDERIELTKCEQQWDYLYVKDASRAYIMLAESDCLSGIYNIASGLHRPLKEYVSEIKNITKSESELVFGSIPDGMNGPINLMPDVTKIKVATDWKPNYSFEEGIKELLKEYKTFN